MATVSKSKAILVVKLILFIVLEHGKQVILLLANRGRNIAYILFLKINVAVYLSPVFSSSI